MTTDRPAESPLARGSDATFRPDVEGLRGVAVLLVVLFHAGLPVAGGFIGVDVFFVISGFLITGLLLREHGRSGRVSYARFYARRVRRLLPAAVAVLMVTLVAAYLLLGVLDRPEVMADGASAALSVANIRFALAAGDYFTTVTQPSPFLHFWSLGVEEQFYLVWPAILFLVAGGGRRRVTVALVVVLVASFGANLWLTQSVTNWAFYSLPGRAWQLAAGGLLAVGLVNVDRLPKAALAVAGWGALVGLVVSALLISSDLAYPGFPAVAPTVAAVILIISGPVANGPGVLLSTAPIRFLGRISYSLYLWHWPILILPALALGAALDLAVRILLALAAIGVAAASWRFIEEPFRRGSFALARPRRVLPAGAAAIAAVVVLAGALDVGSTRAIDDLARVADEATPTPGLASPVPSDGGPSAIPSAADATQVPTDSPTPSAGPITWDQIPDLAVVGKLPLPAHPRPSLRNARLDAESVWHDGCGAQVAVTKPPACVYGNKRGDLTVALVGDSHAAQWMPAFEALATARGWRLVPYVKLSCPFMDVAVQHLDLKREYTECAVWRDNVIATLQARPPDITVVSMSHMGILPTDVANRDLTLEGEAIGRSLDKLPGLVLLMMDNPRVDYDIPACLAAHVTDIRPCAIKRDPAFSDSFAVREQVAAKESGDPILDLIVAICPAMPCQMARDGMILYRDNHHLSATFSASLASALEAALRPYVLTIERNRAGGEPTPRATPGPQ